MKCWIFAAVIGLAGCEQTFQETRSSLVLRPDALGSVSTTPRKTEDEYIRQFVAEAFTSYQISPALNNGGGPVVIATAASHTLKAGDEDWKDVTRAGLNHIDNECLVYLSNLKEYAEFKRATANQVSITGNAATAALSLFDVAATTVGGMALAFGLVADTIDNVSDSVLFDLNPADTEGLVRKAQKAFRGAFEQDIVKVRNRPETVAMIREYLYFCLPIGIERRVSDALKGVETVATVGGNGRVIGLTDVSSRTPERVKSLADNIKDVTGRLQALDPNEPLKPPKLPKIVVLNPGNNLERVISKEDVRAIQAVLCVKEDAVLGPVTRVALDEFRKGYHKLPKNVLGKGLTGRERDKLIDAKPCAPSGFITAFERGFFDIGLSFDTTKTLGELDGDVTEKIRDLATDLSKDPALVTDSEIPEEVRDAIEARRVTDQLTSGRGLDAALAERLNYIIP